ncbi:MAG: hypothetical protein JWO86_5621 [Myxococcaceae bacterium]|nr:hypothetical protein [Myxococcaceae bacterium]
MTTHTRSKSGFAIAAGFLACLACSSTKSDGGTTPAPGVTAPTTQAAGLEFETGPFQIQPGDNFECFYTATTTDHVLNVQGAKGVQGVGGHHLIVYYTDQKVPVGHHKCSDVEMLGLHQVAADAGNNEGVIQLPPGYATKIPAGKQLVIQSHYVSTASGPSTVNDSITLTTLEDKDVTQFANSFVMVDGNFKVPPRSAATSATLCSTPKDLDLIIVLGHMHEWGSHYKLERMDDAGQPLETLYETDWETLYVAHPPVTNYDAAKPLHLPKGTKLRQTCSWKNTEDQEKAFPSEMCVMFSYYVPDDGFLQCDTKAVTP